MPPSITSNTTGDDILKGLQNPNVGSTDDPRHRARNSSSRKDRLQRAARRLSGNYTTQLSIDPTHATAHVDLSGEVPRVVISGREFPQPLTDYTDEEWDWLCQKALNMHESGGHIPYTHWDDFHRRLQKLTQIQQGVGKDIWNALEDCAIEEQIRSDYPKYSTLLLHFRANMFHAATPGTEQPDGTYQIGLAQAITTAILDKGAYNSGTLNQLLDEDDQSLHFASEDDRERFVEEILPEIDAVLNDIFELPGPLTRNKRIFDFIHEVLPEVEDADDSGAEDAGDGAGNMPNDAESPSGGAKKEASGLDGSRQSRSGESEHSDDGGSDSDDSGDSSDTNDDGENDEGSGNGDEEELEEEQIPDESGGSGSSGEEDKDAEEDVDVGRGGDEEEAGDKSDEESDGSGAGDDDEEISDDEGSSGGSEPSEDESTLGEEPDESAETESSVPSRQDIQTDEGLEESLSESRGPMHDEEDRQQTEALKAEAEAMAEAMNSAGGKLKSEGIELVDGVHSVDWETWLDAQRHKESLANLLRARGQSQGNMKTRRNQRRGRIDRNALHRLHSGEKRIKMRREHPDRPEFNFVLVIDRSSSMSGDKIETAERSLLRFALALESLDHNVMILDLYNNQVRLAAPFNQPLESFRANLANGATSGGTPLSDCLKIARERLLQEAGPGTENRMLVVTDGNPSNRQQYKDVLSSCTFPVVGVNIRSNGKGAGSEFYHRSETVRPDGSDLDRVLGQFARELLDVS